jgi:hypothetical protein
MGSCLAGSASLALSVPATWAIPIEIHQHLVVGAGFSLNADAGATLREAQIVQRFARLRVADVIIAHVDKPHSDTAAGLAVALADLLQRGYRFVRLDGAALTEALPSALSADRNGAMGTR